MSTTSRLGVWILAAVLAAAGITLLSLRHRPGTTILLTILVMLVALTLLANGSALGTAPVMPAVLTIGLGVGVVLEMARLTAP